MNIQKELIIEHLGKAKIFTRPLVILGVFLVIYSAFGLAYYQQQREQKDLVSQIDLTSKILRQSKEGTENLEEQLARAQARLASVWVSFPTEELSTAILDAVLNAVSQSEVEFLGTLTYPTRTEEIGEHTYQILSFDLNVGGSFPQLMAFLHRLEKETLDTLVVEQVKITEDVASFALRVSFSVYARISPTPDTLLAGDSAEEDLDQQSQRLTQARESGDTAFSIALMEVIRDTNPGYEGIDEMLYQAYIDYGYQLIQEEKLQEAATEFRNALSIYGEGEEAEAGLARVDSMTEPETVLNAYSPNPTNDTTPTFTGNASDATTNIVSVEYRVDGGPWLQAYPLDVAFDQPSEAFTFTPERLDEGIHTFESRAVDTGGTVETTPATETLTIDITPPRVVIELSPLVVMEGNTSTILGTATDELSPIASVEYRIDWGEWVAATAEDGVFDGTPEKYSFTIPILAQGDYTLHVRATDSAGNVVQSRDYVGIVFTVR